MPTRALNRRGDPSDPPPVTKRIPMLRAALALVCCSCVLACGPTSDEGGEARPGALRLARALLSSLLSEREEPPETGSLPPRTPPDPEPLVDRPEPEAEAARSCRVPYAGPVTIIPVRAADSLARAVAERREVLLVYETDDTAIWSDGRVMTTDMETLGEHLNAVGWAENPITIAGPATRPGASGRNPAWSSSTSFFEKSGKQKRRRRRG